MAKEQAFNSGLRVVLEAKYYPITKHKPQTTPVELQKPLARITRSLTVDAVPLVGQFSADSETKLPSLFTEPSTNINSTDALSPQPLHTKSPRSTSNAPIPTHSPLYHLHTIWLFTVNDLKSIVLPHTIFGLSSALSGPCLTTNSQPSLLSVLSRLPTLLLWTYLNVLIFDVSNQRLAPSILEDSYNKSWRPLPSRRLTPTSARRFLLALLPTVTAITWVIGGCRETVAMIALTWMYNDLGGADEHYLVRNAINALGFICYAAGTTAVAAGPSSSTLNAHAPAWLTIIGLVILTTLQMQDLPDVEGDAQRGRKTLPLVAGQTIGRWSVAAPVVFWSLVCPAYWNLRAGGFLLCGVPGLTLAWRVLRYRSVEHDRVSWKLWCLWSVSLYLLPLCADHSIFGRAVDDFVA